MKKIILLFLLLSLSVLTVSCKPKDGDPADEAQNGENQSVSLDGVTFSDATFTYDGEVKSVTLENLPDGCTVEYQNNEAVDAGTYDAAATVKAKDGTVLKTFFATLTVNPAPFPSRIVFNNASIDYTGEPIYIEAKTLENFLTITYEGNGQTEPGTYTVTAYFTSNDPNYLPPEPKSAKLTVVFVELPTEGLVLAKEGTAYTVTGYTGTAKDVLIPAAFRGVKITKIAKDAFAGNVQIASVTIRENVANIGARAFDGCTSLADVTLGEGLLNIGSFAFRGCTSLSSAVLPKSLSTVGKSIFGGTCLTSLTVPFLGGSATTAKPYLGYFFGAVSYLENPLYVPETLKRVTVSSDQSYSIPANAFSGCSHLESIRLLDGVYEVCNYAFSNCTALSEVYFGEDMRSVPAADFANVSPFYGCSETLRLSLAAKTKPAGFGAYWNYVSLFKTVTPVYGATKDSLS